MIRNYFTDSYKNGVIPIISATQLIDGAVKVTQTVTVNNNLANLATSTTLVIPGQNPLLKRGMYITAPFDGAGGGNWTINDHILIEAISRSIIPAASTTGQTKDSGAGNTLFLSTLNTDIVVGMVVSGFAGGATKIVGTIGAPQDNKSVIGLTTAVTFDENEILTFTSSETTTTTITLNKPKGIAANIAITFFTINQSSWKEYNLFIGSSPAPFLGGDGGIATTGIGAGDAAGQTDINLLVDLGVGAVTTGMKIYNTTQNNLFIGSVARVDDPGEFFLTANIPVAIAANDVLTFAYPSSASVSVLTLDNQTVTIKNPAEGFVLPLSVVQITATANGLSNIRAFE